MKKSALTILAEYDSGNYLDWHKWKDKKPRAKRWVLLWFAKDKEYEVWNDMRHYMNLCSTEYVSFPGPTLWSYIPSQRDMVEK